MKVSQKKGDRNRELEDLKGKPILIIGKQKKGSTFVSISKSFTGLPQALPFQVL